MTYLKIDNKVFNDIFQVNSQVFRKESDGRYLTVINCKQNYSIIQNQEFIDYPHDCFGIDATEFNQELEIALSNLKITK